ncbi:MAG: hypothetical protein JW808_06570 [Victivallales bacterium]|nr:hypothetical protein [Victivallales bacterium]
MGKLKYILPAIAMLLAGCVSNVADYPVTQTDMETYSNTVAADKEYQDTPYVLETRGDGEIACVNIGSKQGVAANSKISFYTVIESRGSKYMVPFAEGRVFQFGEDISWVRVKSPESAKVRKNHFAKIASDQSYSFAEKMLYPPRFWQGK